MKRTFYFLAFVNLTVHCVLANTRLDSLYEKLNQLPDDTQKVITLLKIGYEHEFNTQYDSGVYYVSFAKALAERLHFTDGIASALISRASINNTAQNYEEASRYYSEAIPYLEQMGNKFRVANAYNNRGLIKWIQGKYPEAVHDYRIALELMTELKNIRGIANANLNMGLIHAAQGNYPEAVNGYLAALAQYQKEDHRDGIAKCYNNLGSLYLEQNQPDDALQNFRHALKIYRREGLEYGIALSLHNIGMVHKSKAEYGEAIHFIKNSLAYRLKSKDSTGIADCYDNLGIIYDEQKMHAEALRNIFMAAEIYRRLGIKERVANSYISTGLVYLHLKNYKEAKRRFDEGMALSKEIGIKLLIRDCYRALTELDSSQGNFTKAFEDYKMQVLYRDSLVNDESTRKIVQAKMNMEFEKKEAIAKSEHEKKELVSRAEVARHKLIRNSTLGGVGIAGLFSMILIRTFNRKKKASFEKQVAEVETKALRSQMNPHFIFNSLNSIDDYILNNDIQNSSLYVNKFSRLMRLILESSRKEEITVAEDIETLQLYMQLENLRMKQKVDCVFTVSPELNAEQILIPPMLLQPFIENCFKHAFDGVENPSIHIEISLKGEMLHCVVTDNGKGRNELPDDVLSLKVNRKSLGLTVTRERLDIISKMKKRKASLAFEDIKDAFHKAAGTRVELTVPASFAF